MERSARAWLSIVVVQAMGSVWMCFTKQTSSGHYSQTSPTLSRAHGLPLALICVLRIVLVFNFSTISLHIAHIILSLMTAGFTILEVFYYRTMEYGIVNVTEVTLNGFSSVVMIIYILSASFNSEKVAKVTKGRKITAKHYMEGTMLTPDEDDELVQKYRKMK